MTGTMARGGGGKSGTLARPFSGKPDVQANSVGEGRAFD